MGKAINDNGPIIISVVFSSLMVFYSRIPIIVVALACALYSFYLIFAIKHVFDTISTLFLSCVFLVPTSTISIIGTNASSFPLTWFHLFAIILFMIVAFTEQIRKRYFVLLLIFIAIELIMAFTTLSFSDSLKQILTMTLFLVSFIIGPVIAKKASSELLHISAKSYVYSTIAFALQVFLQRAFIRSVGVTIGHYAVMGVGRTAYSGLMGDYSFATLYLATGCMIAFIQYLDWKEISFSQLIVVEYILLAGILAVTSRTGIAALAIILIIYFLANIRRLGWKTILLLIVSIIAIPIVINKLVLSRNGQNLLDSSGRIQNYTVALNHFTKKPILGIGLGIDNLTKTLQIGVPHNFFVQYLLQIGILGLVIIILFFVEFLTKDYNKSNESKWVFWLVVVGSMLIPDVFSSRYYFVIMIMCMLPSIETNQVLSSRRVLVSDRKSHKIS